MLVYQQIGAAGGVGAIVSRACNDRRGLVGWVWWCGLGVLGVGGHTRPRKRDCGSEMPQSSTIPRSVAGLIQSYTISVLLSTAVSRPPEPITAPSRSRLR